MAVESHQSHQTKRSNVMEITINDKAKTFTIEGKLDGTKVTQKGNRVEASTQGNMSVVSASGKVYKVGLNIFTEAS